MPIGQNASACLRHCLALFVIAACLLGSLRLCASPALADETISGQPARRQVLVYYADETAAQASQSKNYATVLAILRGSSKPLAATLAEGIVTDGKKFPLLVQRDSDALEIQARRLGFDLAIFTNALAFEGHYLLLRAGSDQAEIRALPPISATPSTILATSPLSRPEYFRAALFLVGALYPPNSLDIVLVANGHGGSEMALIPRVNADMSQPGAVARMRRMLETDDMATQPAWAVPQGTSKIEFWRIIGEVSSTFGARFPLVFREVCLSGLRSWTEFFAVPQSVGLIADTAGDEMNGWDLDYAQMLGNVSPDANWTASLSARLKDHGVHVHTWATAWTELILMTLQRIPVGAFFIPLVLWLAWSVLISARSMRHSCVYRKPKSGRSGDEVRQGSRVN